MKFNLILIIFFLTYNTFAYSKNEKKTFMGNGFAYIYNEADYKNKITKKKFDNKKLAIGHSNLKRGTHVKIVNPNNNKSIILRITKKTKYPEFYQILITEKVANKLNLDFAAPYVELQEIKKNKSFIAKKAKTFNEEKNIYNSAPVDNVSINNISKSINYKKKKIKKFSIIIANFYSLNSANNLKKNLVKEMSNFKNKSLIVKKVNNKRFTLLTEPYSTVNSLKNDYIALKTYGFEDLEIKLYD
tara:strand:- start:662 stop:1393 length:732 start_codon:yes stop_codon:yes gene_type:complete